MAIIHHLYVAEHHYPNFLHILYSAYILLIWELYQNGGFIKSFILVLKKTYLFFIVSAFYLIVRFFLFGIGSCDLGYLSFSTRVISFKHYIWNGFEVLKDLSGFTFLSNPDPRLKVLILVPFVVFLLFLFFKSTKKIYLWLLGVATLMFSWPSWLVNHHDRYLYLSLPFFILFLLILFKYSKIDFRRGFRKKLVNVFFYILILWGAIDSSVRIKRNAELTYLGDLALKDLAKEHCENISENTLLVFCGLPHWLFYPCLPQAIWLYSGNEKLKVFDVRSVDFIIGNYRRLESYKNIKEGFSVHKIKNGYRFISNDEKLYFYAPPNDKGDVYNITVGIKVVNERYDKWRAKSVSLIFDKELFASRQDVKFFSWDWRKQRFCLL